MSDSNLTLNDSRLDAQLQYVRTLPRREGSGIMGAIARYMKTAMQLRFRTQVGTDGKRWPQSKAARKRSGQTLIHHKHLLGSLTTRSGIDYAEAGTNVVYARVNHFGILRVVTVRPHRRMTRHVHGERGAVSVRSSPVAASRRLMFRPARPFAGFSAADPPRILEILRRRIAAAAQK